MSAALRAVPRSMRGSGTARPASILQSTPSSISSLFSPLVICRQCRRRRIVSARTYSTSACSTGVAKLGSRRLISVAGPDAAKYLQGVITSSILRLQIPSDGAPGLPENGLYSAFLSAQGRVLHDVFVYRDTLGIGKGASHSNAGSDDSGAFLVEVDADEATTLTKHIKRYKLRAKFDVRLLDAGELSVWHGWGLPEGSDSAGDHQGVITYKDTRVPGLGWRFVTSASSPPLVELDGVDESAYRVHRYRLGVAEGQREILYNQALPLESNIDLMGGIDFHKGCYVGQELTIRTRHRGVVRKRILPCIVYSDAADEAAMMASQGVLPTFDEAGPAAAVPAETSIGRVGKKGRSAGKWLSGVGNLGLALCRLETMTDVVLPGEAVAATAAVTFDPSTEFVLKVVDKSTDSEGDTVKSESSQTKIKAIVPDWLRQGLTSGAVH